jgi:uncharacterized protein
MRVAYVDSSVVVRYYLPSEAGHTEVAAILNDPDTAAVTATLTTIEVSGTLVRAARTGHVSPTALLDRFDQDIQNGIFTLVSVDQEACEKLSLKLVREHGIRALDALHVATADLSLPELLGPGDVGVFISRDLEQAAVAKLLGWTIE